MSALAAEHRAVNLGQGFPDYAIDPALIDLVAAAMHAGHNQYPLSAGVMALREAIAARNAGTPADSGYWLCPARIAAVTRSISAGSIG